MLRHEIHNILAQVFNSLTLKELGFGERVQVLGLLEVCRLGLGLPKRIGDSASRTRTRASRSISSYTKAQLGCLSPNLEVRSTHKISQSRLGPLGLDDVALRRVCQGALVKSYAHNMNTVTTPQNHRYKATIASRTGSILMQTVDEA